MGLIFALSSVPSLRVAPDSMVDYIVRKVGHMLVFGVLAVLIVAAWPGRRSKIAALVLTIAYAVSDETHQAFVPGRHADPLDVGFDTAGALLALWLTQRAVNAWIRPQKPSPREPRA